MIQLDVGNLVSGSSAFSKPSLNIWKFSVHVLLKPSLENSQHYFASVWDEYSCAVLWAFFGIAFLWDWNENWPFPVLWPLLSFPNLLAHRVQHFHSLPKAIWSHTPGCLALGEPSNRHGYLSHWVLLCSCHFFLISSTSVKSIQFLPLLCQTLHEIFSWYIFPFLIYF